MGFWILVFIASGIALFYFLNNTETREYGNQSRKANIAEEKFYTITSSDISKINLFFRMYDNKYICHTLKLFLLNEFKDLFSNLRYVSREQCDLYGKYVTRFNEEYRSLSNVDVINDKFIELEKKKYKDFFADINGISLDNQQQTAIITDDDHNLVVAGAGSGKTLTIAGKVKYLCELKGINPEEILLISFTRKSAEEMTQRISDRMGIPIRATTFHKLGLDIITNYEKTRPDVVDNLNQFVDIFLSEKIKSYPKVRVALVLFFALFLHIPSSIFDFKNKGQQYEFEKNRDLETLKSKHDQLDSKEKVTILNRLSSEGKDKKTMRGEIVRSVEELYIANYLYLNGINYEYERSYPYQVQSDINGNYRKKYRPDFYLTDYDIYLEHFGISKDNKVPWLTDIEEKKYLDGIVWKRNIHKEHGTKLIETYSYYFSDDDFFEKFDKILKENNVVCREIDYDKILEDIEGQRRSRQYMEFEKLCCSFITLFKENGYKEKNFDDLIAKIKEEKNSFLKNRASVFISIIKPIYIEYQKYLADNNYIDFSDMIMKASELIEAGYKFNHYKYVIIDEFQDISHSRYRLVKDIISQNNAKLMCVGDDWQSIYRFTGSDISIFSKFENYFGFSKIMFLENTYRNSQELIDKASEFILKNPLQLKKKLKSNKNIKFPLCFMLYDEDPERFLKKSVEKIISEFGVESDILILGRTNYDIDILENTSIFKVERGSDSYKIKYIPKPEAKIRFLTIHKAKGLEADNVILLNFNNSLLGIPNKISDDPIINMLLSTADNYLYAEERRLFYVAMTRTKNRIYILSDENNYSEFLHEFNESKSVLLFSESASKLKVNCPKCQTGKLRTRINPETGKSFLGCSNYPQCDFTSENISILNDPVICPECGGFLVKRKSEYGGFMGCLNYPYCTYTVDLSSYDKDFEEEY